MRDYLKILSSILVALLTLAVLVSVISVTSALASGDGNIREALFLPFFIVLAGFILFGITGSIFWLVFLKMLGDLSVSPMIKHTISVSMSVVASVLIICAAFVNGIHQLAEAAIFLIPVVLVAALSLLWYWWLFRRSEFNTAQHGNQ